MTVVFTNPETFDDYLSLNEKYLDELEAESEHLAPHAIG